VIQQAGLFPHRTIADNIATVPLLLGWDKRKARQRSMELMERVGLPTELAGRYPPSSPAASSSGSASPARWPPTRR
jgi:osmoprotectant transport system ATP-binding protein